MTTILDFGVLHFRPCRLLTLSPIAEVLKKFRNFASQMRLRRQMTAQCK